MQTRTDTAQVQLQKISVNLIRSNALLQCTNAELVQLVDQEQQWNPAIEAIDDVVGLASDCPRCPLGGKPACTQCLYPHESTDTLSRREQRHDTAGTSEEAWSVDGDDEAAFTTDDRSFEMVPGATAHVGIDRLSFTPAPSTLAQDLLLQLGTAHERVAGDNTIEYLIDSLDDQGYLRIDPGEACALLGISTLELEGAIRQLQSCEPAGIGARDLRECLRLQIEQWAETHDSPADPLALTIVRDHWDLFAQHRTLQLIRKLRSTDKRVDQAVRFIQEELTPYPGGQYREPWRHRPDSLSEAIRPDVVIARTEHGFAVEVAGSSYINVQINRHYRLQAERIRLEVRRKGAAPPSPGDQQVLECVGRAENLLANIRRRSWALRRIAGSLIEHQQGFLETGQRGFLRPLTRTQIAAELGMHESTVSRTLLHKYVQLPNQDVVPFDCFFKGPSAGREAIAEMIAHEDPADPLSDQQIADALAVRGIPTARRTVAKYREELRLPPSHMRRAR